ncbi:MAG: MerR family transcriptional regulator [Gemmatimonadota bacterium]|nr:MAG: MerR family transcriptional regulator [Gemmatimonadota bacterium]
MSDTPLYTIREIAQELQLPESTVRYYRDAFPEHVATVGTGRRRRYPPEATAVLRSIADGYAKGQSREQIEAELFGGPPPTRAHPKPRPAPAGSDDLLATILDGERERREAMWQIAREIVRLGEAIERQQVILGEITEQLMAQANRTLPPGAPAEQEAAPVDESAPAATTEHVAELEMVPASHATGAVEELEQELRDLQAELANERELVERLRKSKLDIERRAAEAEERLGDRAAKRRSVFERLRSREEEGDG